jgi:hypothetical protein
MDIYEQLRTDVESYEQLSMAEGRVNKGLKQFTDIDSYQFLE